MQGTAADIIKRAMIELDHAGSPRTLTRSRMLLQVHDELVFEVLAGIPYPVTPSRACSPQVSLPLSYWGFFLPKIQPCKHLSPRLFDTGLVERRKQLRTQVHVIRWQTPPP
jgi:hypothetical protein